MLYSYRGEFPTHLPNKLRLSDGTTRTDSTTFTENEIADAGWIFVGFPPEITYPNKLEWNGTEWIIREPHEGEVLEKWQNIRKEREELLRQADVLVIRSLENSGTVNPAILEYKQKLRDITTQEDPWNISWPQSPQFAVIDPVKVEEFK